MKKSNIKSTLRNIIDGFLVFFVFITTTVYALPSNGVTYDNSNSGSTATTVNEALDDLYTKVNDKQTEIDRINGIGDATAGNILQGKTALVKGQTITGSIPSKGATTYTPSTSNQTIASGNYLSGVQTIKGDANLVAGNIAKGKSIFGVAGTYTSDANAVAANILKDKTAYVKGSKITGTIPSKGAATYTPGKSNQTIAAGNYLSGAQTIKGDANLVAGNIKKGVSIFGVSGTYIPTGTNAGIHVNETTNYCGIDWTLKANVSAGTYIVTNVMYSGNGTGSASTMSMSPLDSSNGGGVTAKLLSSNKTSYNVVETYLVTLTSNKSAGTAMGRMSNCSYTQNTYTLHGKSIWVKIG